MARALPFGLTIFFSVVTRGYEKYMSKEWETTYKQFSRYRTIFMLTWSKRGGWLSTMTKEPLFHNFGGGNLADRMYYYA